MKRRKFTAKFKTKVVLEALTERYTMAQLEERHKLHPNQISQWKAQFLTNADSVFEKVSKNPKDQAESEKDQLLKMIGQQKVEIDFLKNALR
jgi:transposase